LLPDAINRGQRANVRAAASVRPLTNREAAAVHRGARLAAGLRGVIGILTLALIVLAAALARS
jgi:hypothetical protein